MEFEITRTSSRYDDENAPCENCYKKGDKFYIKIDTLDELLNFVKSVHYRIIIDIDTYIVTDNNEPSIEIYDDCRE